MNLTLSLPQKILISALLLLMFGNLLQQHFKQGKTDKIIQRIEELQDLRAIDSLNYLHLTKRVDEYLVKDSIRAVQIQNLKSQQRHEQKKITDLEEKLAALRGTAPERPHF